MGERDVAICILGAMMGAGFASGREIMQFFSRWGDLSWGLILLVAMAMAGLCCRVMKRGRRGMTGLLPGGRGWGAAIPALLMTATAGSMTAASGELAALMVPIHHARTLGMAGSLAVSLWMTRRPLNVMAWLSRLMLPGMIGVFILCMALPGGEEAAVPLSFLDCAGAVISVLGYAGMNVMLAAGVLCQAGGQRQSRGCCRAAAWAGAGMGGMLLLANGALLPYSGTLSASPLPVVELLRAYGKTGYYLAGCAMYLAVITTLIAAVQGLSEICAAWTKRPLPWAGMAAAVTALMGFEEIVAGVYPALGCLCFILLTCPEGTRKKARP